MIPWIAVALALAGEPEKQSTHVQTDDGAWIALHRYARAEGPAVLLCHGISSNHHFWDLAPGRSLALHLWERGFDVWNLDLRGHGAALHDPTGRRQRPGWTIDDYGHQDLPTALDHVVAHTGMESLHFVGHSLGGMVLAVYLADVFDPPLSSAVVVASPLDFRDPDVLMKVLLGGAPAVQGIGFLPTPIGARGLSALKREAPLQTDALLYNPDNLARRAESLMLRRVVSPLSRGEVAQLAQARHDGAFRSSDGGRIYREHLGHVKTPIRFIAGRADRIVSPDRVWSYHQAVGSPHRDFRVAARANGLHADYGHLDLGVGDHAAEDVYPWVASWLERWR